MPLRAKPGQLVRLICVLALKDTDVCRDFEPGPILYINFGLVCPTFEKMKDIHYWRGYCDPMDRPWYISDKNSHPDGSHKKVLKGLLAGLCQAMNPSFEKNFVSLTWAEIQAVQVAQAPQAEEIPWAEI